MPKKEQQSRGRPATDPTKCAAVVSAYRSATPTPSLRSLAKSHELSVSTVSRILEDAGINILSNKTQKPHRRKKPIETGEAVRKTLKDVALEAGVSVATASRALKGSGLVSPTTTARVEKAAQKLNYQVHPHVSATMAAARIGRIKPVDEVIAYLFSSFVIGPNWKEQIKLPYGPIRKFEAARDASYRKGYKLEPFDFVPLEADAKRLEKILYARGIRGLVLDVPSVHTADSGFDFSRFNTVAFREQWHFKTHVVGHNHFLNMMTLFTELWLQGYRRIGLVSSDASSTSTLFRRDAGFHHCQYHLVPKELRIPILHFDTLLKHIQVEVETGKRTEAINRVEETDWLWQQDWSQLKMEPASNITRNESNIELILSKWLEEYRPEVVIWEDMQAVERIEKLGYQVPKDMGVAHSKLNAEVSGWSGLQRADEDIGSAAVEHLIRDLQLAEQTTPKHPILQRVAGQWVNGHTTKEIEKPLIPLVKSATEWIQKVQVSGN